MIVCFVDISQFVDSLFNFSFHNLNNVNFFFRTFVTRDLYHGGKVPERHDLTLFPTVNDLKNHIHQALKDVENGTLPLTAPTVSSKDIYSLWSMIK